MNIAHPNYGLNYRLIRAALTMREFTVSELRSLARAGENSVYSFLSDLNGAEYLRSTPLPGEGRGRPRNRYSLTEAGVGHLMRRSLEMARRFDQEEAAEPNAPRPADVYETGAEAEVLIEVGQTGQEEPADFAFATDAARMVVEIGRETDILILSRQGTMHARVAAGRDMLDEAVVAYILRKYNLLIGEKTAWEIQKTLGLPEAKGDPGSMEVEGRNLIAGTTQMIKVSGEEIREALGEPLGKILTAIREALGHTSLLGGLRMVLLTGEGRLIRNLDRHIRRKTGLSVSIAEVPSIAAPYVACEPAASFGLLQYGMGRSQKRFGQSARYVDPFLRR